MMLLMIMFMYNIKSSLMLKSKGITQFAWHVSIHVFYIVVYEIASGVAYTEKMSSLNWNYVLKNIYIYTIKDVVQSEIKDFRQPLAL